jgi:hypothetical protein
LKYAALDAMILLQLFDKIHQEFLAVQIKLQTLSHQYQQQQQQQQQQQNQSAILSMEPSIPILSMKKKKAFNIQRDLMNATGMIKYFIVSGNSMIYDNFMTYNYL